MDKTLFLKTINDLCQDSLHLIVDNAGFYELAKLLPEKINDIEAVIREIGESVFMEYSNISENYKREKTGLLELQKSVFGKHGDKPLVVIPYIGMSKVIPKGEIAKYGNDKVIDEVLTNPAYKKREHIALIGGESALHQSLISVSSRFDNLELNLMVSKEAFGLWFFEKAVKHFGIGHGIEHGIKYGIEHCTEYEAPEAKDGNGRFKRFNKIINNSYMQLKEAEDSFGLPAVLFKCQLRNIGFDKAVIEIAEHIKSKSNCKLVYLVKYNEKKDSGRILIVVRSEDKFSEKNYRVGSLGIKLMDFDFFKEQRMLHDAVLHEIILEGTELKDPMGFDLMKKAYKKEPVKKETFFYLKNKAVECLINANNLAMQNSQIYAQIQAIGCQESGYQDMPLQLKTKEQAYNFCINISLCLLQALSYKALNSRLSLGQKVSNKQISENPQTKAEEFLKEIKDYYHKLCLGSNNSDSADNANTDVADISRIIYFIREAGNL